MGNWNRRVRHQGQLSKTEEREQRRGGLQFTIEKMEVSERLSNLTPVTQPEGGRTRTETRPF